MWHRLIYFVRNDPEVPPANYGLWVAEMGLPHTVVRLDAGDELPSLRPADAAIILGGRMSADDIAAYPYLGPLVDWLRNNAVSGRPQLGICLGGQLLAMAAGGRLYRQRHQELGATEIELTAAGAADALFKGVSRRLISFSWHNDSFEPPPDAVRLGYSTVCPEQAFRWKDNWGLQFHPEVDMETVRGWAGGAVRAGDLTTATAETALAGLGAVYEEHVRSGCLILANFLAGAAGGEAAATSERAGLTADTTAARGAKSTATSCTVPESWGG